MQKYIKIALIMLFVGCIAVLVAGAIHNNKPMLIGATIGLIASALAGIGAAFASRSYQNVPISSNVSVNNPISNV
jgi:drug/metabolite transporter (DMT)-like permease